MSADLGIAIVSILKIITLTILVIGFVRALVSFTTIQRFVLQVARLLACCGIIIVDALVFALAYHEWKFWPLLAPLIPLTLLAIRDALFPKPDTPPPSNQPSATPSNTITSIDKTSQTTNQGCFLSLLAVPVFLLTRHDWKYWVLLTPMIAVILWETHRAISSQPGTPAALEPASPDEVPPEPPAQCPNASKIPWIWGILDMAVVFQGRYDWRFWLLLIPMIPLTLWTLHRVRPAKPDSTLPTRTDID